MSTVRPTKKQRELLDYIESFISDHGYSPSYREIMNGCGYNSIATVAVHINNLIARGHLRKRDHSARSLELTGLAAAVDGPEETGAPKTDYSLELKIEQLMTKMAAAGVPDEDMLDDIRIVLAALHVLGARELASSVSARVERLKADSANA